ncbi:unnamed protein product [Moneuplotes crassus]|uniref:Uncharacterized protein n=1 Tax=Euplotes crassus TaxID=5936 RepID=A0AAD1XF55_EUPCR|nr:unnamed protein product [Moneuplotes crassus]
MDATFSNFKLQNFKGVNCLDKERFMKKFNLLHDKKDHDRGLPNIKIATKYLSKFVDKELGGRTLREKLALDQNDGQKTNELAQKDFCRFIRRGRKHPKVLLPMKNKRQIKAFSVESNIRRNGPDTKSLSHRNSFLNEISTNCTQSGIQDPPHVGANSLEAREPLPSNLKNIQPTLSAINVYTSLRNNVSRGDLLRQGYFANDVMISQKQFSSARRPLQSVQIDSQPILTKRRLDDIQIQNIPKKIYLKNMTPDLMNKIPSKLLQVTENREVCTNSPCFIAKLEHSIANKQC